MGESGRCFTLDATTGAADMLTPDQYWRDDERQQRKVVNMKDTACAFFIGMGVFALIAAFMPGSIVKKYHEVIDACEAELPRNMECEIVAVPKQESK